MKVTCSAHIPDSNERDLLCEWLRDIEGCTHNVIGTTIIATYSNESVSNDVYWCLVRLFEQYEEHNIHHSAQGGGG